jgi:hypothetical protein
MGNSGLLFDPTIVSTFMKRIVPYPIGSTVRLSNGLRGIVLYNYSDGLMRPRIKVIRKNEQGDSTTQEVLDLYNDPSLLSVTVVGFEK